jgi:hypothetical protein
MKTLSGVICAIACLVAPAVANAGVSTKEAEQLARKVARNYIYKGIVDADSYSYGCVRNSPHVARCVIRFYLEDDYLCSAKIKVTEHAAVIRSSLISQNCV